MEQEIIQALSNININSETAEALMQEYVRLQYMKIGIVGALLLPVAWGMMYILCVIVKDSCK
jgi:hypothetical protein